MALAVQVVIDCARPGELAQFWALALGYQLEPPPPGFATWDEALDAWGLVGDERDAASAVVDPAGVGPRLFFQRVPEPKSSKNRVHIDVRAGGPRGTPEAERWPRILDVEQRLLAAGATRLREVQEPQEHFLVLADPEGNELCLT